MEIPKIVELPTLEHEMIEVALTGGNTQQIIGRSKLTEAKFYIPKIKDSKEETWLRLKYGAVLRLRVGEVVDKIVLEGYVFEGVIPISQEDDVYTCDVVAYHAERYYEQR